MPEQVEEGKTFQVSLLLRFPDWSDSEPHVLEKTSENSQLFSESFGSLPLAQPPDF